MARIRTIKPDFFTDAELADLSPLHRLLFQALWCHADRDGRMEDKPREIKVKCMPYDACDVHAMLGDLHGAGFIIRYQLGGKRYLAIPGFGEHQRFHKDEKPAGYPPPPEPTQRGATDSEVTLTDTEVSSPRPEVSTPEPCLVSDVGVGRLVSESEAEPPRRARVAGDAPERAAPPAIAPPTTPPDSWTDVQFWAWAQSVREAGGLFAEGKPRNETKLQRWFSEALGTSGVTVPVLKEAFYAFGQSSHWGRVDTPYPFQAFMSEWRKFLPPRNAHVAP